MCLITQKYPSFIFIRFIIKTNDKNLRIKIYQFVPHFSPRVFIERLNPIPINSPFFTLV